MSDEEWNAEAARVVRSVLLAAIATAVVAAVLFAFRPDLLPPLVADWIDRAGIPRGTVRLAVVAAGVQVVIVAAVFGWRRSRRQRRERFAAGKLHGRRERFAAGLSSELPKGYDPATDCRATRWRKGRPQRVAIRLPAGFADHSDSARASLTKAIGERMDTKARGTWSAGEVTFRPINTSPDELARDRGRDRVAGIAAELFGGRCTIGKITEWGGPDGFSPVAFSLGYPLTTKDDSASFRRRTESVIGDKLGIRLKGEWDRQRDRVALKPAPPMPENVTHPGPELCRTTDQLYLPLGVDADGAVSGWDARKFPHVLVNGSTGSGKTSAFRSAIVAALIKGWEVYLCDPKRIEFSGYRLGPRGGWGVKSIASKDEDMSDLLTRVRALMETRYAEGEARIQRGESPGWDQFCPVLVVLDEFTELVLALGDLNKARSIRGTPEAVTAVGNLARMARVCGIHLAVLMQRPDADSFPAGARENFTYRISLNALSEQSARMMWQNPDWGRYLPPIRGRGLAGAYGSEPQEVQFFWTPDPAFPAAGTDEQLRDQLRSAAEAMQADIPASIEGRPYDLGPLRPSSEADRSGLVSDPGDLAEVRLADGRTVETVRVLAETLTQGDRILRDGQVYEVRQVQDDAGRVKVVIRARRGLRAQAITCEVTDHVSRVDENADPAPSLPIETEVGGSDAEVLTVPAKWETEFAEDAPPLPGQDHTADDDDDLYRPPEPSTENEASEPRTSQPAADEPEPVESLEQPEQGTEADMALTAMFRTAWASLSGDERARHSLIASAPDTPAMRDLIAALQAEQAERKADSLEDLEPGQLKDGERCAADLRTGDRVRMQNRKGQRPAYEVTKIEPRSGGRVGLTLKPARGKGREVTLAAGELVELD